MSLFKFVVDAQLNRKGSNIFRHINEIPLKIHLSSSRLVCSNFKKDLSLGDEEDQSAAFDPIIGF